MEAQFLKVSILGLGKVIGLDQEWEPRGPNVVIGDTPWLARMTDKARATAAGTNGDYEYP